MPSLRRPIGLCCLLVLALVCVVPARADDVEEEIEALELRIEVLVDEIAALVDAGHDDVAALLERRVRAYRREVAELRKDAAEEPDAAEKPAEEAIDLVFHLLRGLARDDEDREAVGTLVEALRELAEAVEDEGGKDPEADEADDLHAEVRIARERRATMRVALEAFLEAGLRDAAHRMEHAIHALELALEGRRDDAAREVRTSAPDLGRQAELLERAAKLLAEWGQRRRAERVHALGKELARIWERRRTAEKRPAPRRERETDEFHEHLLKAMHLSLVALKETGRADFVNTMERAILAAKMRVARRRDAEARKVYEASPGFEDILELMGHAASLYEKWGKNDPAELIRRMRDAMRARREAGHPAERAREGTGEKERHLDALRDQVRELLKMAERLTERLEEIEEETEER